MLKGCPVSDTIHLEFSKVMRNVFLPPLTSSYTLMTRPQGQNPCVDEKGPHAALTNLGKVCGAALQTQDT